MLWPFASKLTPTGFCMNPENNKPGTWPGLLFQQAALFHRGLERVLGTALVLDAVADPHERDPHRDRIHRDLDPRDQQHHTQDERHERQADVDPGDRSEEHTSELQSLR